MTVYYLGPPKWGPVVINKSAFDPNLHLDASAKVEPEKAETVAPKRGRPRKRKEA
jgi:hypothetical protein